MATHQHPAHHTEPQLESPMDYAQHEATYNGFLVAVKWISIGLAVAVVVLYFLIQP